MAYSISMRKAPQRKTAYTEAALAPTAGEAIEIRVAETHFINKRDFWAAFIQLEGRMREQYQPTFAVN